MSFFGSFESVPFCCVGISTKSNMGRIKLLIRVPIYVKTFNVLSCVIYEIVVGFGVCLHMGQENR